jgi:hypothetical protein
MIRMGMGLGLLLTVTACKRAEDVVPTPNFEIETAIGVISPLDETLAAYPGIPGVMNADDDNEDGVSDWDSREWQGDDDDYTTVSVVSTAKTFQFTLSDDTGLVRIWSGGEEVLGPDSTDWSPEQSDDISMFIEFGAPLSTAELKVKNLTDEETVTTHLTAAPMILGHHQQVTEKVWIMKMNFRDYSNAKMVSDMEAVLGDRLFDVNAERYDYDVWVQDEFEWSSMVSAESRIDVVIDSIRDGQGGGGLDDAPEDLMLGSNSIVRTWGSGWANTYDSFGNLEVSPPLSVDGVDYPYGRIYYGKKGSSGPVAALTDHLDSQRVQAPFYVDTTWLCVGHIDEFTTFLPDPTAPRGFRFLFSDTRAGWEIVEATDPGTSLPLYAPTDSWSGHGIPNVGAMAEESSLKAYNEDIQLQYLDPILEQFKEEFGLLEEEIVLFPSVFEEINDSTYGRCGAAALVPGAANMLVVNETDGSTHAFMADPFFRSTPADQSSDPFIDAYKALLPPAVTPHFVDDFEVYHLGLGEVHCGTNSLRTPLDGWWENSSHLLKETGE